MSNPTIEQEKITLEGVLEHLGIFDYKILLTSLRDRFSYVEWTRIEPTKKYEIIFLYEIEYIRDSLKIEKYYFEDDKLTLETNHGILKFQ